VVRSPFKEGNQGYINTNWMSVKHAKTIHKHTHKTLGLLATSFIAFISLGLPDGLLSEAWPGIRRNFHLPVDALGIVLVFGTGVHTFVAKHHSPRMMQWL
jgi:hypothetical protein